MSARLPRPGGLNEGEALRARVLHTLRCAPTTGGDLRRRFGSRRADRAICDLRQAGLILRDEGGYWWLTGAGLLAARGPVDTTTEVRP